MRPELVELVSTRANPGVDPALHVWGWEVPVYLFLGGLVAGLLVLVPALELRTRRRGGPWLPLVALGLISAGMGALWLDLENKPNVYRFYLSLRPTSPMSWGAWILLLVYPALGLLGLGGLQARGGRLGEWVAFAERHRRGVLWTSVASGIGLGTYTGLLLGTLVARPLWNTALLGPLFLISGLSAGAALLMLTPEGRPHHATLARWDMAAISVELVLLLLLLVDLSGGGAATSGAAALLLGGPWTPWFWGAVVLGGLVVPLALEATVHLRRLPATHTAPVLVLIGGLALRWVLVAAGQDFSWGMLP